MECGEDFLGIGRCGAERGPVAGMRNWGGLKSQVRAGTDDKKQG